MPEKKVDGWKNSKAKQQLKKDILDGTVPPHWKPKQVFATRPELYKDYEKYFATNLRNLRASIKAHQDRADEDYAAVLHNLAFYPRSLMDPRGYPRWDGSTAQVLLKQDISAGSHEGINPKVFRLTREEYMAFPPKVFSDHLHQEV
jgi:hypothetical protein